VSFCWRSRAVLAGEDPHDFPVLLFATGLVAALVPFARAGGRALRT
jgi:hypothetical protein